MPLAAHRPVGNIFKDSGTIILPAKQPGK